MRPLPDNNPDALQADIEQTRKELVSTVDELSAKFDVRARVKHGVADATARVRSAAVPITGAVVGVLLVAIVIRRRRQR
jgi:hypothetical protein